MEVARVRALRQAINLLRLIILVIVEMEVARVRALRQCLAKAWQLTVVRGNGGGPNKGIETVRV